MEPLSSRMARADTQLAAYAVPHEGMLGRERAIADDATRFPFQRDRDRIIHATAFRRLKGKTQVFVTGDGDHYRTRLTHTIEVAHIARDIARTLGLNEDLCECIALAHDLGHPPFGHGGEAALDGWMRVQGERFEHNRQSHRIVTVLERHRGEERGLNLNREVLEGILKHESPHDRPDTRLPEGAGHTLEAQVVNLSDEIAYTCHDCDDGLREGLFSLADIRGTALGARAAADPQAPAALRGSLIELLLADLYAETERRLAENGPQTPQDVRRLAFPLVAFSGDMRRFLDELRGFLWRHMYLHPRVVARVDEGKAVVSALCGHFQAHPNDKIADLMRETGSSAAVAVKDYVAGMTDAFAQSIARELRL